jgi:arabinose-5-phosphate isomerase
MEQIIKNTWQQEITGLKALSEISSAACTALATDLVTAKKLVVFSGVGKSGNVGRKLASTFTSLGIPSIFIDPTEAAHGGMGILDTAGALIVLSRSGTACELVPIMTGAVTRDIPVRALIAENTKTDLGLLSNFFIPLPKISEAWGHAPTTSTTMQMAIGDAIAIAVADARGFTETDFQRTHPGGALGNKGAT